MASPMTALLPALKGPHVPRGLKKRGSERKLKHSQPSASLILSSETCVEPPGVPRPLKCARVLQLPTGLVHDPSHSRHQHPRRKHPERPERIDAIMTHLQASKLLDACTAVPSTNADEEDLVQVHNKYYIKRLSRLSGAPLERLLEEAEQFDSVFFNESTVDCAKRAAGGLMQLVKGVVTGELCNGLALIRPPGHHAEAHHARGFCVINNVAVAASYARHKLGVSRVCIVDWDVHHGNGTQRAFLHDPSVLYISLHRYDHGRFFPGGSDGSPSTIGTGPGAGYTINLAWNEAGMGDGEYLEAMRRVVLPAASAFDPELILVSAGFDGVVGDEIGGCHVTPECFGTMTAMLMTLARGRVVLALEGGYKLSVLPHCVESCLRALLHEPLMGPSDFSAQQGPVGGPILPEAEEAIQATLTHHRQYLLGMATASLTMAAAHPTTTTPNATHRPPAAAGSV